MSRARRRERKPALPGRRRERKPALPGRRVRPGGSVQRGRVVGPCRRGRGDAGVAGVLVLALAGVLMLAGAVSASLAAVAVARQRAASAADLSALAAAEQALLGQRAACAQASRVAEAVGARLRTCTLTGSIAEVEVQVRPPGRLGQLGQASARAKAGPGS